MFSATRRFIENISIGSKNHNLRSSNHTNSCSLDETKSRFAVRFFMQKSKRFDLLRQQMKHTLQQISLRPETSPECLFYLGLAPRNAKAKVHEKEPTRQEKIYPDFQFLKPRVFECSYCSKVFFHKLVYRRHMIRHLKKIHWCMKCNRGFTTKIGHRRHQLTCRR